MPISINGTGTITGISAGGLPDGSITADDLASSAVTTAKVDDSAITTAKVNDAAITFAKLSTSATESDNVAKRTAKAWVNFNGQGTINSGSIRGSFNVSSITDNGTGDYTVNFASALADANYIMNVNCSPQIGFLVAGTVQLFYNRGGDVRVAPTTTAARFSITGNVMDPQDVCVLIVA